MKTTGYYNNVHYNKIDLIDSVSEKSFALLNQVNAALSDRRQHIAFWITKPENKLFRFELRKLINQYSPVEISSSNWSQICKRGSFNLSISIIPVMSAFLMSNLKDDASLDESKLTSLQALWTGNVFDYYVPCSVNLFVLIYNTALPEEKCFIEKSIKVKCKDYFRSADTSVKQIVFDRLIEYHFDHPHSHRSNPFTELRCRVPLETKSLFGDSVKNGATISDVEQGINLCKLNHLLNWAYILRLPIDFFLKPDYLTRTVENAIFLDSEGCPYKINDLNQKQSFKSVICQFASLSPDLQMNILSSILRNRAGNINICIKDYPLSFISKVISDVLMGESVEVISYENEISVDVINKWVQLFVNIADKF